MEDPQNRNTLLWVWMSLLGKPVNKAIRLVYDIYKDPETAWNESRRQDTPSEEKEEGDEEGLLREEEEKPIFYARIKDESLKERACGIMEEAKEKGIRIITRIDPLYPEKLLHI